MQPFEYMRPKSLEEVISLLQEYGDTACLLAGGTDLTVGLRHGKISPQMVIDIKGIADLSSGICESDGWLTISAATVLSDITRNESVKKHFPALVEAAGVVGSIQIRNRATLAGNICNASPAADTVPVLAVYGAVVRKYGPSGIHSIPVVDFIKGNRDTALLPGELVISVDLPIPTTRCGTAFSRITRRRGVDLATVNICCHIDGKGTTTYALGAVSPRPLLVQDTKGYLSDPTVSAVKKAAELDVLLSVATPITDIRASAEYRSGMLRVLAERVTNRAIELRENWLDHG